MELIIVTGLSGAGKSQANNCLEDMGYYCVDNMPPALIRNFVTLLFQGTGEISKVALVVDIRGGQFFDDFKSVLNELRSRNLRELHCRILFLEASDEVLLRRYKETRRSHPLSGDGSIRDGIEREKEKLKEIRDLSDYIIDTSELKSAQLNVAIRRILEPENRHKGFQITVESFGYKYGIPLEADMVFDIRFLPNPFYVASLKKLTGNNKKVQDYVMKAPEAQTFIKWVVDMVRTLIPSYEREGKYHLVLAFGCTGGQHRSVTIANEVTERLRGSGESVVLIHRELK